MTTRPTIYVAGPMTTGDKSVGPYAPIGDAARVAKRLWDAGWAPFVPQLNATWEMVVGPLIPGEKAGGWLEYDFQWLGKCDAFYRIPGQSSGADQEEALAREWTLKLFVTEAEREEALKPGWRMNRWGGPDRPELHTRPLTKYADDELRILMECYSPEYKDSILARYR